jgi:hypothetical protein
MSIDLSQTAQIILGCIGVLLVWGMYDMSAKIKSLNKIEHIDDILTQLKVLVEKMAIVTVSQEVTKAQVEYLKDRINLIESRLSQRPDQ